MPWVRVCLVVSTVWFAALTVAWSPDVAESRPNHPDGVAVRSPLVAQNSLPAAHFTLTNPPAGHATNRPGQSL